MRRARCGRHTPGVDAHDVKPADDADVRAHVAAARPHTLVLLAAGPVRDQDEAEAAQIQAEHLRHLVGLQRSGELVVNGPVLDDASTLRGVSLYRTADIDRVRAWVDADPAVTAGRLTATVLPWFGVLPGDERRSTYNGEDG